MPIQKLGIDSSTTAPSSEPRANQLPGRTAATVPVTIPTTTASTILTTSSEKVGPMCSTITGTTGRE